MNTPTTNSGFLIAIEGIDGSGKSTLANGIHALLVSQGIKAILTREPGATQLGKQLRTILMERNYELDPKAEFLLFAADRAQHFTHVVLPALAENTIVISDRTADSSLVYQGYGRGLDIPTLSTINAWAMQGIKPALTIFVQIDCATALERINQRNLARTAFEKEHAEFTQKLIDGFAKLYQHRDDVLILDGKESPEQLVAIAAQTILKLIHS